MELDRQYDVVVVGAGFGGIGTALSLAEKGLKVALFEYLSTLEGVLELSHARVIDLRQEAQLCLRALVNVATFSKNG